MLRSCLIKARSGLEPLLEMKGSGLLPLSHPSASLSNYEPLALIKTIEPNKIAFKAAVDALRAPRPQLKGDISALEAVQLIELPLPY